MKLGKWIDFKINSDGRGDLVALEGNGNIPFEIKRVYFLKNTKSDHPRGFHAHRKLNQVAICLSGSLVMVLDNGHERESVTMNSFSQGLLIGNMIWREMHSFSEDCVLMVLADQLYSEEDYIRDYNAFLDVSKIEKISN